MEVVEGLLSKYFGIIGQDLSEMGLLVHSGWKETAIDYKFRLPLHQQNDAICI